MHGRARLTACLSALMYEDPPKPRASWPLTLSARRMTRMSSRRADLSIVVLSAAVALTLLSSRLSAQGAGQSDRNPRAGRVVVEQSSGELELPARAARLVRVGGTVIDTLD